MARGTRWALGALVVLLVAVGGVWALGGFRETTHTLPEAAVGESVDLGRYAITVDSARYVDRDVSGEPLKEDGRPAVALVVRIHARMLDREAGDLLSGSQPAVRVRNGRSPWDTFPRSSQDPPQEQLQPGLDQQQDLWFDVSSVASGDLADRVDVVLGEQTFGWTNLIDSGPAWSSVGVPAVAVAGVPVTDGRTSR